MAQEAAPQPDQGKAFEAAAAAESAEEDRPKRPRRKAAKTAAKDQAQEQVADVAARFPPRAWMRHDAGGARLQYLLDGEPPRCELGFGATSGRRLHRELRAGLRGLLVQLGDTVEISGLQRSPQFNGSIGYVLERNDHRVELFFPPQVGETSLLLNPENVKLANEETFERMQLKSSDAQGTSPVTLALLFRSGPRQWCYMQ